MKTPAFSAPIRKSDSICAKGSFGRISAVIAALTAGSALTAQQANAGAPATCIPSGSWAQWVQTASLPNCFSFVSRRNKCDVEVLFMDIPSAHPATDPIRLREGFTALNPYSFCGDTPQPVFHAEQRGEEQAIEWTFEGSVLIKAGPYFTGTGGASRKHTHSTTLAATPSGM